MPTKTIILNTSNYNQSNGGNSFVYKFPTPINFSTLDKIGVQSISLFNSIFNITAALGNNFLQLIWPCYVPTGSTCIFNGYIGNSASFLGSISNPSPLELYGSTVSTTVSLTGFIGGTKVPIAAGYISGTVLKITSGTPALTIGMYMNGSGVSIVSGSGLTWNLSGSSLGTVGSAASPATNMFACPVGNTLYVTTPPTSSLTASANQTIFITGTNIPSYSLTGSAVSITTTANTYATSAVNVYASSVSITAGIGSSTFIGTSDAPIYPGYTFVFSNTPCTVLSVSITGTLYTLSLSNTVGIFNNTLITNVKIPVDSNTNLPSFSLLTVNSLTNGSNGILPNYTVSGYGVASNVSILSQISSLSTSSNAEGLYKISYNPSVSTEALYASDAVLQNSTLTVTSIVSGTIQSGMILKDSNNLISNYNVVIGSQISGTTGGIGSYNISSSSIVPSIFPEEIVASASYSSILSIPITIPDGYYTASSLNYFLQNVMIQNNLYLTDSTGQNNTYFLEILQNSVSYSLQINIFPLPIALSSTLYYPENAIWTLPNTVQSPQLLINSELTYWFGFSPTYAQVNPTASFSNNFLQLPSSTTVLNGVLKSYVSNVCPQINSISSIIVRCNLINSNLSNPSDQMISIPLKANFGNIISIDYNVILLNVRGGLEQNITLSFYDPYGYPISVVDNDITVQLIIEQANVF